MEGLETHGFRSPHLAMSDSLRIADHLFNDAESLVECVEHSCRVETREQVVYDQITSELLPVSTAAIAILWVVDRGQSRTLSRSGISVSPDDESVIGDLSAHLPDSASASAAYSPPLAKWTDRLRLETTEQLGPSTIVGLSLQFEQAVDGSLSRPLCELSETILGLASGVYLRHRFTALSEAAQRQTHRDVVLNQLNDGCALTDSLASVAGTVARETNADRVAILRTKGCSAQLVVSSTQPRVDRRARQVRLLETLVSNVIRRSDCFRFVVGNPEVSDTASSDAAVTAAVNQYLNDSGCRELSIEAIFDQQADFESRERIAAIVLERFRVDESAGAGGFRRFDDLRIPAFAAIRRALERNRFSWGTILSQLSATGVTRRFATLTCASLLIALALALVPADFKIPVEGRLRTAEHHRLYAPSSGTVVALNVNNGQSVTEGQPLLRMRSSILDQQQRQLEGELATAKSKLAVVRASRSRSAIERGSSPDSLASSDEQVLKTEVSGLQAQLDLVIQQQSELTLVSPMAGRVDRWDLQQSLTGRPVVHGQYLIDIVSSVDGWIVELDIPDAEAQYVAAEQAAKPCEVTFRLRSNPEKLYRGTLEQLSSVTQFDSTGHPVVRATFGIDAVDEDLRFGATVIAHVHCGSRPLGFVWFRSVFEWARQIDWI